MSRGLGPPGPSPRCRSYTYMGSCRNPPPGLNASRDSNLPTRTQNSHHVPQTDQSPRSASLTPSSSPRASARSHAKKKRNSAPSSWKPKEDRLVIGGGREHILLTDSDIPDDMMDIGTWSDAMDKPTNQSKLFSSSDTNKPIRKWGSSLEVPDQQDSRYPRLSRRIADIPELEEDDRGSTQPIKTQNLHHETRTNRSERNKVDDSGGDSSSWMTRYIAHNAPLGNEKKGESSLHLSLFWKFRIYC